MKVVLSAFAQHCATKPQDIAIVDEDGHAFTWAMLQERVASLRALIHRTTKPNARVCISIPSGSSFWIAVLATASAGRTPCLLPCPTPGLLSARLAHELGPDLFMLDEAIVAGSRASIAEQDDAAPPEGAILLSSGTTERSRFILRSNHAIDLITNILLEEDLARRDDCIASFLPMHHAYGFEHAFLAPIAAGARLHALGAFSIDRAAEALANGATTMPLVPITVQALADASLPAPKLRSVVSAGSILPPTVRRAFETTYSIRVTDLYGASELGTVWLDRGDGGKPVRGVEISGFESAECEGEVLVRSDSVFDGVVNSNGKVTSTLVDGCFHTGDIGVRSERGTFRITGRTKLVFDVGGLKVNPIEIEQALELHPAVRRALVKPVSAGSVLQRVAADIELKESAPEPSPEQIRAHLAPLVAAHAIPRTFNFITRIPTTPSGKIIRSTGEASVSPVLRRPDRLARREDREQFTTRLFDASARGYDNSSGAVFLRGGRWYRRRMLANAGLRAGGAHLDVGSGTGLCAAIAQDLIGSTGRVVALDPSKGMLEVAKRRGVREIVEGRAESLPFPDHSFDTVSMSYMLRHIDDLVLAFREARRVLKPSGRIVIFEVTRPASALGKCAFDLSMYWIVPTIGVFTSGRPSTFPMMHYWAETMKDAARPDRIVTALDQCGFLGTRHLLELGVFSCYRGTAPPA